jgi:hypothetical protein
MQPSQNSNPICTLEPEVDVRVTDTVLAQANRNGEVALELGIGTVMMRHVENNAAFGRVGEDFFVNSATGLRKDQVARDFGRVLPVGSDGAVPYRALFTAVVEDQPKPGTMLLFGEIPIRKAVEELRGCGKRQAQRVDVLRSVMRISRCEQTRINPAC